MAMTNLAYDTMQVCENGHLITPGLQAFPEQGRRFCERCGAATIAACPSCQHPIPGQLCEGAFHIFTDEDVMRFCGNCGRPFPWTTLKLYAAKAMADELEGLSDADRIDLKASFDDIAANTPMAEVGVLRIKKLMRKAGKPVSDLIYKFAVDVASETAVKSMKEP